MTWPARPWQLNRVGWLVVVLAASGSDAQGQPVGSQGDANVFSMSPTKLLITGEGGLVATDNNELAKNVRVGREYGNSGAYDSAYAGLNARLPEINALMVLHSLKALESAAQSRNRTAQLYHQELGCLPGLGFQEKRSEDRISYKDFSLTVDEGAFGLSRDELATALAAENVDTRKYYEPPVHRQTAYARFYDGRPLPHTDWLASTSLSLPIWSEMDAKVAGAICTAIQRIHQHAGEVRRKINHG